MREKIEDILIERVVSRQETTNEKILREISKTLAEIGNLLPNQYHTVKQQLKYNESLDKIIKILSESTGMSKKDILRLFEERAKVDYDFAKKYYKAKNVEYLPYEKNLALKNKVDMIAGATFDETFGIPTYSNIALTTGITFLDREGKEITAGIKEAYKQIVDDAIMNVSTGRESFFEALSNQLKTIGEHGVQQIEYKSGYHRRIDSALRMNLKEGLTRLSMEQQKIMGNQFGADGVEITVHEAPAPDHAPLQGLMFENNEFKKLQSEHSCKDADGQHHDAIKRQIGQWNCYHTTFAVVLGVDEPRYSKKELQEILERNEAGVEYEGKHYTLYEASQKQRQLELALRRNREQQIMHKEALKVTNDEKEADAIQKKLDRTNKKIGSLVSKYHDFSKKSGLPTRLERARVLTKK